MQIVVDGKLAEQFNRKIKGAHREVRAHILRALRESARLVAAETRSLLRSARSPSPPGGVPGRRTGRLSRSIRTRSIGRALVAIVFSESAKTGAPYARFLEVGTGQRVTSNRSGRKSRGRMEARPAITLAKARLESEIAAKIGAAIEATLDGLEKR